MSSTDHAREANPPIVKRILHIDMDAFYASIEQRDNPALRQRPVAVGRSEARGVVAAASYEARRYGVRSAMPSRTALQLCPALMFIPPQPEKYRAISAQIHAIFSRYTPLIQPLALDEAALDVTDYLGNFGSATAIAEAIRRDIVQQTQLTASAGVSYNRFLAKLASDQNKPNGLFVITPKQGPAFAASLPVEAFHGIGPATTAKMHALGVRTGADLKRCSIELLRAHFGSSASFYYNIARGIDHRPVEPHRPRKSIGNETTFRQDSDDLPTLLTVLEKLTVKVWTSCLQHKLTGSTVTIKIRTNDFQTSTRARTLHDPISNQHTLLTVGTHILESFFPLSRPVRLLGITVSGLVAQDKADTQLRLSFLDPS